MTIDKISAAASVALDFQFTEPHLVSLGGFDCESIFVTNVQTMDKGVRWWVTDNHTQSDYTFGTVHRL